MKIKILSFLFALTIISSLWVKYSLANTPLNIKLSGKILLQTEQNGEAWYVFPDDLKRYYLGRPEDAFSIMNDLGIGISNSDINKIPVAIIKNSNTDSDKDGLSDDLEIGLGTNPELADSDNDGYNDLVELNKNYNPNGSGKLSIDEKLTEKLSGKIVLQTERNGEAWYISPDKLQRYFLGRPSDAFAVMRELGLGITDSNLNKIAEVIVPSEVLNKNIVKNQTKPTENPGYREYSAEDLYTFKYPTAWRIKKYPDNIDLIHITDAYHDFITEDKAVISIQPFSTESDFSIASFNKEEENETSNKDIQMSDKKGFEKTYKNELMYSRTILLKLEEKKFLQISLYSKNNDVKYNSIYNELIESFKFE